jgi:DNA-directed RNA polymerase specialized sigma24 family protein
MIIKCSAKSRSDEVREWYEQFGPALVAYASSIMGDRGSSEDALQQVFLKLLKGNIEVPTPAKPYLFRAVRNTALSLMRRSGRNVPLQEEGETGTTYQQWFEAPAELGYWSKTRECDSRALENFFESNPIFRFQRLWRIFCFRRGRLCLLEGMSK